MKLAVVQHALAEQVVAARLVVVPNLEGEAVPVFLSAVMSPFLCGA